MNAVKAAGISDPTPATDPTRKENNSKLKAAGEER
jgi:hypothetical protein